MKQIITLMTMLMLALFSFSVFAGHDGHSGHGSLHKCLKSASAIKEGYYAKLEYLTLTDRGSKTYEIEIHDKDGLEWELMCDISAGTIYEIEREVESASDPLFKKNMKVNEDTAKKTALVTLSQEKLYILNTKLKQTVHHLTSLISLKNPG